MPNKYVNKVVIGKETKLDLTADLHCCIYRCSSWMLRNNSGGKQQHAGNFRIQQQSDC